MSDTDNVPRTPDDPDPEDILAEMDPGTPYTVADFEGRWDVSRWTIRRRLEELHEEGEIQRRKHSDNVVTWWIEVDVEDA